MERELVQYSSSEGEVMLVGEEKTFALDFSNSTTDVYNTQETTVTQNIYESQSGFAEFAKGANGILLGLSVFVGLGILTWAFIKKSRKKGK